MENPINFGQIHSIVNGYAIALAGRQLSDSGEMGRFPDLYVFRVTDDDRYDQPLELVRKFALSELDLNQDLSKYFNYSMGVHGAELLPNSKTLGPNFSMWYEPETDSIEVMYVRATEANLETPLQIVDGLLDSPETQLQLVQASYRGDHLALHSEIVESVFSALDDHLEDTKQRTVRTAFQHSMTVEGKVTLRVTRCATSKGLILAMRTIRPKERYWVIRLDGDGNHTMLGCVSLRSRLRKLQQQNTKLADISMGDVFSMDTPMVCESDTDWIVWTDNIPYQFDTESGRYTYATRFYQPVPDRQARADASAVFLPVTLNPELQPTQIQTNQSSDACWIIANQTVFGIEDIEATGVWARSQAVETNPDGEQEVLVPYQLNRSLMHDGYASIYGLTVEDDQPTLKRVY